MEIIELYKETYTNGILYRRSPSFREKIHDYLLNALQAENPELLIDPLTAIYDAKEIKGSRRCEDRNLVSLKVSATKPFERKAIEEDPLIEKRDI